MGNTLWLDPLVHKEYLPHLKQGLISFNVRSKLLELNVAEENPTHLQLLYDLIKDLNVDITIPGQSTRKSYT